MLPLKMFFSKYYRGVSTSLQRKYKSGILLLTVLCATACVFDRVPPPTEVIVPEGAGFLKGGAWAWDTTLQFYFNNRFLVWVDTFEELTHIELTLVKLKRLKQDDRRIKVLVQKDSIPFWLFESMAIASADTVLAFRAAPGIYKFSVDKEDVTHLYGDSLRIKGWKSTDVIGEPDSLNKPQIGKIDSTLRVQIFPAQDIDYFEINIPKSGIYEIYTPSFPKSLFLEGHFFYPDRDSAPTFSTFKIDSNKRYAFRLAQGRALFSLGSQFLQFNKSFFEIYLNTYTLDSFEPNNTQLSAYELNWQSLQESDSLNLFKQDIEELTLPFTFYPEADEDFFKLIVADNFKGIFSLSGQDSLHPVLGDVSDSNKKILYPINTEDFSEFELRLAPGSYFIRLTPPYKAAPERDRVYTLKIKRQN